jgi:hypothetical protein
MIVAARRFLALACLLSFPCAAWACDSAVDLGKNADVGVAAAPDAADSRSAADGNGPADGGSETTTTDVDAAVDAGPKRIFVTRSTYAANFGGIAGGDLRCQSSAEAAGLTGTFKAWLSDSTTNAADRFVSNGPWVEVGSNVTLFPSRVALRGFPSAQLKKDELGQPSPDYWWTGTLANGVKGDNNCMDWTSPSPADRGTVGSRGDGAAQPDKEWTEFYHFSCATEEGLALICLED